MGLDRGFRANEGAWKRQSRDFKRKGISLEMTSREKCILLKESIYQLYVNEGRSKVYISKLFQINRKILSECIADWGFIQKTQFRGVKPSTKKYINNNREKIRNMMRDNLSMNTMAKELGVDRHFLRRTVIQNDKVLFEEYTQYKNRLEEYYQNKRNKNNARYTYEEIDGEIWKPVLGYDNYEVSNKGRVRSIYKHGPLLLRLQPNKNSKYLYVSLNKDKKRKMMSVARLVGHTFLGESYSEINNTINHKDGNRQNNCVENLEWVSQAENNIHSFRELRKRNKTYNKLEFDYIVLNNKYQFKTILAYSKFVGISQTQARIRLDNPEKWGLEIVTTMRKH